MKILVWRSGGLLGRRVEWDVVVDEQPDPEQWYLLIAELPWDERPAVIATPDRYTYRIRCDPHEVVIPEQQLTGPWRELVDRVRDADTPKRHQESEHGEPVTSGEPDENDKSDERDERDEPSDLGEPTDEPGGER